jgi:hypothetical protein
MAMTIYKFKSLANFEHVSDILCNERFYSGKFFDLNDPMEGRFDHHPDTKREFLDAILRGKEKLRICSFSQDLGNLLLWAHYADSFRGICFEVDAHTTQDSEIVEINYADFNVYVSNDSEQDLDRLPRAILSTKNEAWSYEREVRILSSTEHVSVGLEIKAIYFGLRTPTIMKDTIARLLPQRIPAFETQINVSTNTVEKVAKRYQPVVPGSSIATWATSVKPI